MLSKKSQQADELFKRLHQLNPSPATELYFVNNFTLLVAIILSAQATDIGVNKATRSLFEKADTPQKMLELGHAALINHIKTIGLFNNKANNIMKASKILLQEYHGNVPETLENLQKLPGVGRKTANVFLNCALGLPTIGVDTHVLRVSNRLGLADAQTPEKCEQQLLKNIPEKWHRDAHHLLILHGRYICKARVPKCKECSLTDLCSYFTFLGKP